MTLTLRHYLTVAFTMIATVPVLILGLWVEDTSMKKELASVSEKHLLLASNSTAALDRYATDTNAVFELFIEQPNQRPSPASIRLVEKIGFRHICIVDQDGNVISKMKIKDEAADRIPPMVFEKLRLQSGLDTTFSDVMADGKGQPTIYLTRQLSSGRIAIATINLDYIRHLQSAVSYGRNGYSAIVDRSGNIIAHPRDEWQQQAKNIADVKPVALMMAGKSGVTTFFSPVIGDDMITGYSTVPSTGWGMMVPQPLAELEERAGDVKQIALGLIVIGLVIAALISWLLAGLLVKPIEAVVSVARSFARGSLDARVHAFPGGYPTEFHELAASFNTMIHDVARGITEREESERELRITHGQLGRVSKRLESQNSGLEHQIEERTLELSKEISERKQTNYQLAASEQRYKTLYQQIPTGVSVEDYSLVKKRIDNLVARGVTDFRQYFQEHGADLKEAILEIRLLDANISQIEMFEATSYEEYEKYEDDFEAWKDSNWREYYLSEFSALAAGETTYSDEFTDSKYDGTPIDLRCTTRVVEGHEDDWAEIITTHEDITARNLAKRLQSEFVSTVSHELRTPLTSIIGSLSLLRSDTSGKLPDKFKSMLEMAYNNSHRLTRLINDLLDIGKIEAGELDFNMEPVDLGTTLKQALEANEGYGIESNVTFKMLGEIPEAKINGDQDRLIQVISNLLSNAVKYSPENGQVMVSLARHNNDFRISVTDCGPGIPDKFRDQIFQKFLQADSSDTRQKGGTGLGLYVSKAIVEKHSGTIDFRTECGKGTTFFFDLPELANEPADHDDLKLSDAAS